MSSRSCLVSVALVGVLCQPLWARNTAATIITVADIHCPSCAKRLVAKVQALPGILEVRVDMENRTVTVLPKANVVVSPRALWQGVEQSKHRPVRLEGPSGVYTSTPPR